MVLIDDFEKDSLTYLGHYLKLWGDPYGELDGEVKGATIPLNYTELWITSNYSIEDCVLESATRKYRSNGDRDVPVPDA